MKKPATVRKRKLGTHSHEEAKHPAALDANFKQSKEIHEDRGIIQSRLGTNPTGSLRPQRPRN